MNRRMYKDNMKITWIKNQANYDMVMYLTHEMPLQALNILSSLPVVGTKALKE